MIATPNASLICPPSLKKGDTVGVLALASKIDFSIIESAIQMMEKVWGLQVIIGESVKSSYFNYAGTDEIRAKDFQEFLDNQHIKAIFSARGGYGSSRFIDRIDFTNFKKYPKWVVGFSDITEVLNKIQALGFQALHAPMPKTFLKDAYSLQTLKAFIFGEKTDYSIYSHSINRMGQGKGLITGGNLCLLAHGIGSGSEMQTAGKILFIEDVMEHFHAIDRMMVQLKRIGKLQNLQGLLVGDFSSIKDGDEPFGKTVYEIIAEHVSEYNYPVCYHFPVGHEDINWAIPCGRMATLKVDSQEVSLQFEE